MAGITDILGAIAAVAAPVVSVINNERSISGSKDLQSDAQEFVNQQRVAQNEYATSEREAAQDWNLGMWNKANEYNSPAAQLARARAAGINPNSVLPNAGTSQAYELTTSPQSASAGGSAGIGSFPHLANPAVDLINSLNTLRQNELIEGQTKKTESEVRLNDQQRELVYQKISESKSLQGLQEAQKKEILDMLPNLLKKSEKEIASIEKSIAVAAASIKEMEARSKNLSEDTKKKQFENDILKLQAHLAKTYGLYLGAGQLGALVSLALSGEKGALALEEVFNTLHSAFEIFSDTAGDALGLGEGSEGDLWNPFSNGDHFKSSADAGGSALYKILHNSMKSEAKKRRLRREIQWEELRR